MVFAREGAHSYAPVAIAEDGVMIESPEKEVDDYLTGIDPDASRSTLEALDRISTKTAPPSKLAVALGKVPPGRL